MFIASYKQLLLLNSRLSVSLPFSMVFAYVCPQDRVTIASSWLWHGLCYCYR